MKARILTAALLIACVAQGAQAGTVIQQQETEPGGTQVKRTVTLTADAGKLRVEGENPGSGKFLVLFDQSKQVMQMVDFKKNTYTELTQAQVAGMGGQMQDAMKQIQEQMAQMPPQQRAMMEQMMKNSMGGQMGGMMGGASEITVRQKASGEKVGQFTCTRYEVLSGEKVTQEVCATPASELQLDASAFQTFQALSEFFEPLRSQISQMMPQGGWSAPSALKQINGFPVQTIIYSDEKPSSEWRLVTLDTQPVDASLFALPSGLTKTEMPSMPTRPGMAMPRGGM